MRCTIAVLLLLFPSAAAAFENWGDYEDANQIIYLYFNTVGTDGVAETLAGTPDVRIYEDGSDTEIDGGGETLTVDFDTVTGLNQVSVDLSNAAYENGKTYTVVIDAGTVDAVSVVGRIAGVFTVGRYATTANIEQPLATGTAQATDSNTSTIGLAAETPNKPDDYYNGAVVKIIVGTGAGQARVITAYADAGDSATVSPAWTVDPSSDSAYEIVPGAVNVATISRSGPTADALKTVYTNNAAELDTRGFAGTGLPDAQAGASGGLPLSFDANGRVDVAAVNGLATIDGRSVSDWIALVGAWLYGERTVSGNTTSYKDPDDNTRTRLQTTVDGAQNRGAATIDVTNK